MVQRSDQRELVGVTCQPRELLADFNSRHVGRDRPELTTILAGGTWLQIEGLHVAGSTPEPKEDHRPAAAGARGCRASFTSEQVGQAKGRKSEQASPDELSSPQGPTAAIHGGNFR